ncbi:Piso0_002218 [Millerozyma farinosa CBS 7064]|uniref:Piso0_002218 protein n=1 Tax=Pichia sorbitophila (strain ATCC MYA-4447 / BCRC 22081 / CBS 7064 / NBRC 10061 / NRRL Y-12695) TaxID=559304 RepID=G8YEG0_PICSO|nr:Piso0_002218 [Millerozyma farinosa CBS 7064]
MLRTLTSWYKRPGKKVEGEIPSDFISDDDHQVVRFMLKEKEDSFVDIDYKKLTYAEVASLSKNKPTRDCRKQSKFLERGGSHSKGHGGMAAATSSDPEACGLSDSVIYPERIKSDLHYKKHKQLKKKRKGSS